MDSPDPFDPLLRRWDSAPEPKPSLKAEVWRRIAMVESAPVRTSWTSRVEAWFAQPAFSAAFVACCVLIGLFLAEMRVSTVRHERQLDVARQYVQWIDPLVATQLKPVSR